MRRTKKKKESSKAKPEKEQPASPSSKRPVAGLIILASLILILIIVFGVVRYGGTDFKSVYQTKNKSIDITKQLDFGPVKNFEDVYGGIAMIDEKYGISFEKEVLFGLMVNKEHLPFIKQDLDALRKKLDPSSAENVETYFPIFPPNRTEQQLGLLFIDARKKMIESQEKFHDGYSFGVQGLVGDGFSCREEPIILASISALNESAQLAADAKYYFDELLTDSKDVTWDFIGINDDKPLFYHAPVELMWAQLKVNRAILREYCHTDIHTNAMPRESRSINFGSKTNKDLFINPATVMTKKQRDVLLAPLRKSAARANANSPS